VSFFKTLFSSVFLLHHWKENKNFTSRRGPKWTSSGQFGHPGDVMYNFETTKKIGFIIGE